MGYQNVEPNIQRYLGTNGYAYHVKVRVRGDYRAQTVDTLDEARALREKWIAERGQSSAKKEPSDTFRAWHERWWRTRIDLAPSTRKNYESLARIHILPTFGDEPITAIQPLHLASWRVEKIEEGRISVTTVDRCLTNVVSKVMEQACASGVITHNPVLHMPRRRISAEETIDSATERCLTPEQVELVLSHMHPWWRLAMRVQYEGALRIGELAALNVRDIDLREGQITITKSRRADGTLGPPKTKSSRRSVKMLSPATCTAIAALITERGLSASDALFSGPRGGVMNLSTFRARFFRPAVAAAGLAHLQIGDRGVTPHWLRHSRITFLARWSKLSAPALAALVGHSRPTTTTGYTHIRAEDIEGIRHLTQGLDEAV